MVLRLNELLKKYSENIAIYAEQIGLNLYRKIINRKGNLDRKIVAPLASTHKKISNNINFLYFFFAIEKWLDFCGQTCKFGELLLWHY